LLLFLFERDGGLNITRPVSSHAELCLGLWFLFCSPTFHSLRVKAEDRMTNWQYPMLLYKCQLKTSNKLKNGANFTT